MPIEWAACQDDPDGECGTFGVPLGRDEPQGSAAASVARHQVARQPATPPRPPANPAAPPGPPANPAAPPGSPANPPHRQGHPPTPPHRLDAGRVPKTFVLGTRHDLP
ncbi:hypothetical protein [Lentzea sp. CC55]|uniref:hypothetical protein n=1 Tax=Lentzea sp. CC55 TaxID=2884909 RepID=UPI001F359D1D|nr:hypothetical protein [Lentzea sp. CC55]MCG8922597.1 hypothetical protein [Lentzea sp. CC55]